MQVDRKLWHRDQRNQPTVELKDNAVSNTRHRWSKREELLDRHDVDDICQPRLNFNDYFAGGECGFFRTGSLDTTGTDLGTLAAWQEAVSDDNSQLIDPLFVSTTDLHLQAGSLILNDGTPSPESQPTSTASPFGKYAGYRGRRNSGSCPGFFTSSATSSW